MVVTVRDGLFSVLFRAMGAVFMMPEYGSSHIVVCRVIIGTSRLMENIDAENICMRRARVGACVRARVCVRGACAIVRVCIIYTYVYICVHFYMHKINVRTHAHIT